MRNTTDSGVPKGCRAETKEEGSLPIFIDIRLVRGKKSDIFVDGDSEFVKHGTPFSISIISSQFGGIVGARLSFSSETLLAEATSLGASPVAGPVYFPQAFFSVVGVLLGPATSDWGTTTRGTLLDGSS